MTDQNQQHSTTENTTESDDQFLGDERSNIRRIFAIFLTLSAISLIAFIGITATAVIGSKTSSDSAQLLENITPYIIAACAGLFISLNTMLFAVWCGRCRKRIVSLMQPSPHGGKEMNIRDAWKFMFGKKCPVCDIDRF